MSRKMTRQVRPIVGLMLASAMFCAGGVAVVAAPAPQAHAVSMSEYQAKVSNHAKLKSQLANFKIPKRCFITTELPRNTMGKVQKNLLRDQYKGLFA